MELIHDIIFTIVNYWPYYLKGARNTVVLALMGVVGGVACGLVICLLRMAQGNRLHARIMRGVAKTYVEILRGTPVIVQLWIAVFAIPLEIDGA